MQIDPRGRASGRVVTLRADNDAFSPDPLRIMTRALAGTGCEDSPESIFLAWLMSIPGGLDPAHAAERLLREQGRDAEDAFGRRLRELLVQTARWPRSRLDRLGRSRRNERERARRS